MSVNVREKKCVDLTIEVTGHMIEQMIQGCDLNSTVDTEAYLIRVKIKTQKIESITEEQLQTAEEIKV